MPDPYDSVREKVEAIFTEMAGERAKMLGGSILPAGVTSTITAALSDPEAKQSEVLQADQIAFHLTDWNSDAAFLWRSIYFPSGSRRRRFEQGLTCS